MNIALGLSATAWLGIAALTFVFTSQSWANIDKPQRPFLGRAILWPLFVIKWVALAVKDGFQALIAA